MVGSFGFYAEEFSTDNPDLGVGFRINASGESYAIPVDAAGLPTEISHAISTPFSSSSGTAPITWELVNLTPAAIAANFRISGTNLITDAFSIPETFSVTLRATDATGQVAEKTLAFEYFIEQHRPGDPTFTSGGY